jgi:acyl-homoserine-lactone acylase
VKPITTLDAYLLIYQASDSFGQASNITAIAEAQPPASTSAFAGPAKGNILTADLTESPADLSAARASVVRVAPGTSGLPSAKQLREMGSLYTRTQQDSMGSNAIAVGSAGTRDHQHGMLLGNPHEPWDGVDRFYEVRLTIPGRLNVEGATIFGMPLVVIGFTGKLAWSTTVSTTFTFTPYQLTLVPGDPTEYVYNGQPVAMTSQSVTVETASADGTLTPVSRTLWYTRYGPVITSLGATPLLWNTQMAFALDDANANNLRFLNTYLGIDESNSVATEFNVLKTTEGLPWMNMLAADSGGQALYAEATGWPIRPSRSAATHGSSA